MPSPVRLKPTVSVAVVSGVVAGGSPEIETPIGFTPPLSVPFGPVRNAGEPEARLNQSRITWASDHVAKFASATVGTCFRSGSVTRFPPPGPFQAIGKILFVNVTSVEAGS